MKNSRTFLSMMLSFAAVLAMLATSGCSGSGSVSGTGSVGTSDTSLSDDDLLEMTIMNYEPFTDAVGITYGNVFDKYMTDRKVSHSGSDGDYVVVISGNIPTLETKIDVSYSVIDDTEDDTKCYINLLSLKTVNEELDHDAALAYLYTMFCAYKEGYDDLYKWSLADDDEIPEHDRLIVEEAGFEWVEPITIEKSSITGVIKNVSGEDKSATISFILYDENGYQIDTTSDYMTKISNGSSWKFEALIIDFDGEVKSYLLDSLHTY